MAPLGFITASVGLLTKTFSVFSCTRPLTRVLSATYKAHVRCLRTPSEGPPKRPMNSYLRYLMQQQPILSKQNPSFTLLEITQKIALQWKTLSPEQKRPHVEAYERDNRRYYDQLTPAQIELKAKERKHRRDKRLASVKKRERTHFGKPKRTRSALNIFMSEHFAEAEGDTALVKFKSLADDWGNLLSNQKQVYRDLAEDDKIRYENEMKLWEDRMVDIGRADLVRHRTMATYIKMSKKRTKKKKVVVAKKKTT